jgi:quinol monooxygenase YgiN
MRLTRPTLAVAIVVILGSVAATLIHAARTQQNPPPGANTPAPLYVAAFIDYAGGDAITAEGTKEIQEYVLETRKDPGIIRCEALAQVGRANHLLVMEVWQNQAAFEKHEAAQHTKTFRADIQAKLGAPFDQRLHYVVQ